MNMKKEFGKLAMGIGCYMKENPNARWRMLYVMWMASLIIHLKELNWEFVNEDSVPLGCKKSSVNIARGIKFIYKYGDGFSVADKEIKDQIFKIVIQEAPL